MQRRPSTQDLTWLLDLHQNHQLDLDPPYQRRSVWTRKDKQYFLDTIFRNYPSPAIFLHKTISEEGKATYHVVDGKQRTQTILDFVNDRIRIASDFGDVRLNGKKWSEIPPDLKQAFWNYEVTVEMIDVVESGVVNEVFDRLNRNARKLTRQELRHAKFEGWFIQTVEAESVLQEWRTLGVVTAARTKRMADSQFISELLLVILEGRVMGFDQDVLDELYAKYEDPAESAPDLNEDLFFQRLSTTKDYLLQVERVDETITRYGKGFGNFYTLWALVAIEGTVPPAAAFAERYTNFMQRVETLSQQQDLDAFLREHADSDLALPLTYLSSSRGASTDLGPRQERLTALRTGTLTAAE